MVTSSSKGLHNSSYSQLDRMRSINPPILETKLVEEANGGSLRRLDVQTYKTLKDLEHIQNIDECGMSTGVFVFYGHGLPLCKVPVVVDVYAMENYHNSLHQRYFSHAIKAGSFREDANDEDRVTTLIEFGDDNINEKQLKEIFRSFPTNIIRNALQKKIGESQVREFEKLMKVNFHIDETNLNKSEDVCGKNTLTAIECEELGRKELISFYGTSKLGPKGCNIWLLERKIKFETTRADWFFINYNPEAKSRIVSYTRSTIPACKK